VSVTCSECAEHHLVLSSRFQPFLFGFRESFPEGQMVLRFYCEWLRSESEILVNNLRQFSFNYFSLKKIQCRARSRETVSPSPCTTSRLARGWCSSCRSSPFLRSIFRCSARIRGSASRSLTLPCTSDTMPRSWSQPTADTPRAMLNTYSLSIRNVHIAN
jgi:hypothetical protein